MNKKTGDAPEVIFRKAAPIDGPGSRYPGFKPGTTVLKKGTVKQKGAAPLWCDILHERDLAVKLRDGVTIYTDIFRPVGNEKVPAVIAWSPYGKNIGRVTLNDFPKRAGVPRSATCEYQKWEGPCPSLWCANGYAVIHPDARGSYMSEGDIHVWGSQEGRDGYDLIEWLAAQPWCNGKVAMAGNSWLSIVQWFIAAEHPPHLAAIAPWEGLSDSLRHDQMPGGIPETAFCERIVSSLPGNNRVEDVPAMTRHYPYMNAYWKDKAARIEDIDVPAYVVASWTNMIHTVGTLDAYLRLADGKKWLRIHNSLEWPDFYTPANQKDLMRFFDRYLKDIDNGWENTPSVRLSIHDPGGRDTVNRPETAFPVPGTRYTRFFLDSRTGSFSEALQQDADTLSYRSDDGNGKIVFSHRFGRETEIAGYVKLRLWVSAQDADDLDVFVLLEKLGKGGRRMGLGVLPPPNALMKKILSFLYSRGSDKLDFFFAPVSAGRLRVSRRALDRRRSTEWKPELAYDAPRPLTPGEIVPVDIPVKPTSVRFRAGEQLRMTIGGFNPLPHRLPGIAAPTLINRGTHVLHMGGQYDSHLLLPIIKG